MGALKTSWWERLYFEITRGRYPAAAGSLKKGEPVHLMLDKIEIALQGERTLDEYWFVSAEKLSYQIINLGSVPSA